VFLAEGKRISVSRLALDVHIAKPFKVLPPSQNVNGPPPPPPHTHDRYCDDDFCGSGATLLHSIKDFLTMEHRTLAGN